jgi:hypothetical protein
VGFLSGFDPLPTVRQINATLVLTFDITEIISVGEGDWKRASTIPFLSAARSISSSLSFAPASIHIALQDANGDSVGTVSAEIPVGPKWCEIRQIVFGWTSQKFPFDVKTAHTLKIREPRVITVTGKAFYDIGHALPIIRTDAPALKITLHGKFTR